MRLVLDTSVVSAIMRREEPALDRLRALHPGDLVLSSPVAAEIEFGLQRLPAGSRRRTLLANEYERLRRAVRWNDWTQEAALAFGRLKEDLERAGIPVGDMDVIIGSVAVASAAAWPPRTHATSGGCGGCTWTPGHARCRIPRAGEDQARFRAEGRQPGCAAHSYDRFNRRFQLP